MQRPVKPKPLRLEERKRASVPARVGNKDASTKRSHARDLLQSLNTTSQSARTSWLFFLSFMAYLFVAVASVTHADLLADSGIKLPLLQIEIPLASFFLVTPLLLILTHFGVLLHHAILKRKTTSFSEALFAEEYGAPRSHQVRQEISSYFFAQNEAGPQRSAVLAALLSVMTFVTLNLLPLLLLLYFQITFLPVHSSSATWIHRGYVALDVVVLLLIGLSSVSSLRRDGLPSESAIKMPLASAILSGIVVIFSICIATLPSGVAGGSDLDSLMTKLWPASMPFTRGEKSCVPESQRCAFWPTAFLFEQPIDYVSSRRPGFSRSLVVTEKTQLVPAVGPSATRLSVRGRDLRYATFDRSDLRNVDFTAADLSGASLKGADLRGALFGCSVRGKRLSSWQTEGGEKRSQWVDDETCPSLANADLSEAKLSDGVLKRTNLQDAKMYKVDMAGFDISYAKFTNVDLWNSNLTNVNASYATFDGANLRGVIGRGASFYGARFRGADLSSAVLAGSNLAYSDFSGADLNGASFVATYLNGATFFAANLSRVRLWGAAPPRPKAFALSTISDPNFSKPQKRDLNEIKDAAGKISKFPFDETSWAYPVRFALLEERNWDETKDRETWSSILDQRNTAAKSRQALGRYLAELGCGDTAVMKGMMDLHFLSWGYGYYSPDTFEPLRPAGVSSADLNEVADESSLAKEDEPSPRYDDDVEIVSSLVARVKELKCESKMPRGSLPTLETLISQLHKKKSTTEFSVVAFGQNNISILPPPEVLKDAPQNSIPPVAAE